MSFPGGFYGFLKAQIDRVVVASGGGGGGGVTGQQPASNSSAVTLSNENIATLTNSKDSGATDANTLRVVMDSQQRDAALFETWDKQPGKSVEIAYYSGVVAGNPSGNKNVQTRTFKTGATTELTITYTWDADDDVLTITTA